VVIVVVLCSVFDVLFDLMVLFVEFDGWLGVFGFVGYCDG